LLVGRQATPSRRLNRLAEVMGKPPGRIEAHGLRTHHCCQLRLEVLEFGDADLLGPLIAQLVEYHLALSQHVEAERSDLQAFAAGI
jgi:hypothetical protein